MPKVRLTPWSGPSVVRMCPHHGPNGMVHDMWHSRAGTMGICQMSDEHLNNAIKMLLKSMQTLAAWYRSEYKGGGGDYDPGYQMSEMKLEMLCRERTRREMVLKGWASDMQALEEPKTELIQGHCSSFACSQGGCDGGCLVRVLTDGLPTYLRDTLMEESAGDNDDL